MINQLNSLNMNGVANGHERYGFERLHRALNGLIRFGTVQYGTVSLCMRVQYILSLKRQVVSRMFTSNLSV